SPFRDLRPCPGVVGSIGRLGETEVLIGGDHDSFRSFACLTVVIAAAMTIAAAVPLAWATAAIAQDVADGQRIWKNKAGCPECHGWAETASPPASTPRAMRPRCARRS